MKHVFAIIAVIVVALLLANNVSAHPAWGIVVDRQGQVYFSDLETIWKIDRQGTVSVFRQRVRGRHVHDITIDAEDSIYGLDNAYNPQTETFPRSIWKMSLKGDFSYLVPLTDNLPLGRSIWQDSGNNSYSVEPYSNERKETKIIKLAPGGTVSHFAGGKFGYLDGQKSKAQFSMITDMAFGADNAIYLTDADKVRKIDKFGMVTTIYRKEVAADRNQKNPETPSRLFGLDVDKKSIAFVADPVNRRVLKIFPGGKSIAVFSTEQPWKPNGVVLRGSDLYILESWHDEREAFIGTRVRKLSADGRITVLATVGDKPKQTAKDYPGVEHIDRSNGSQQNVPVILFGVGLGITTAIVVASRKRKDIV